MLIGIMVVWLSKILENKWWQYYITMQFSTVLSTSINSFFNWKVRFTYFQKGKSKHSVSTKNMSQKIIRLLGYTIHVTW